MSKNQNTAKKQVNQRDDHQYGKGETQNFQEGSSQQQGRGSNQQEDGKGQNYQEKGGSSEVKGKKGIYGGNDDQEKMSYKGDQKAGQGGLDNSRMHKDSEYKAPNAGGQTNQHDDYKVVGGFQSPAKKPGGSFANEQSGSQGSQGRGQAGFQGKEQYGSQGSQGQEEQYGSQSAQGNKANMYQVEEDRDSKKWMVHPVAGSAGAQNEQWCVECNNQNEANTFKKGLLDGKTKPPTQGEKGYKSRQSKGKTIYTRDSE